MQKIHKKMHEQANPHFQIRDSIDSIETLYVVANKKL